VNQANPSQTNRKRTRKHFYELFEKAVFLKQDHNFNPMSKLIQLYLYELGKNKSFCIFKCFKQAKNQVK